MSIIYRIYDCFFSNNFTDIDAVFMTHSITSVFNTDTLQNPDEKLQAYRDNLSVIVDISPEKAYLPRFNASVTSTMLDGILMSELCATRLCYERNSYNIGHSGIDHVQVVVVKQGNKCIEIDGRKIIARAGDIILVDQARPYTTQSNILGQEHGTFETLNFVFARQKIEAFLPYPHLYHGQTLNPKDPMVAILRDFLLSVSQQVKHLNQAQADQLAQPIIELMATALNKHPDVAEQGKSALASANSLRIRRFIDEHIANPDLSPEVISAYLNLGRTAVFEACRPFGGVMTMVRKRRLNRAYRQLLQNPETNISLMAFSLGFKSLDTFLRAFKREFGMTPKEASQQQLMSKTADHKHQLSDWLLHAII